MATVLATRPKIMFLTSPRWPGPQDLAETAQLMSNWSRRHHLVSISHDADLIRVLGDRRIHIGNQVQEVTAGVEQTPAAEQAGLRVQRYPISCGGHRGPNIGKNWRRSVALVRSLNGSIGLPHARNLPVLIPLMLTLIGSATVALGLPSSVPMRWGPGIGDRATGLVPADRRGRLVREHVVVRAARRAKLSPVKS